jgi:dsDNA-specific endonuclease/ATPase MutS2
MESKAFIDFYISFSTPTTNDIVQATHIVLCADLLYSIQQFYFTNSGEQLIQPLIADSLMYENAQNPLITNATPISYALNAESVQSTTLNNEMVSILTGANSGGKTTLLELLLTSQYLSSCGLLLQASYAQVPLVEEIVYLKKFSGTQGAGAFEQTIKELLQIISTTTTKLLLIDEFEAITEPGAAATILTHFLQEVSKQSIYCVSVSHLGSEIQSYIQQHNITSIRIDGISAKGLDEKGNLLTNHQPEFNSFGRSTPELILKRVQNDSKFINSLNSNAQELLLTIISTTQK